MGNLQGSHENSLEEQEMFEMQVDESYNPSGLLSDQQAKIDYLRQMHKREAQEYRKRYLISSAKKEDSALVDQQAHK